MNESRRHQRVKDGFVLQWQAQDKAMTGQGRVLNISASGILFETDKNFTPFDQCVFLLQSLFQGKAEFLPARGRLVWNQKKGQGYLCGVEFIDTPQGVLNLLHKRVEQIMDQVARSEKTKNIVGVILCGVMVILTIYVLHLQNTNYHTLSGSNDMVLQSSVQQAENYRTYVQKFTETKKQLEITTTKLEQVTLALNQATAELSSTKILLTDTQNLLAEAQSENGKLKEQLQSLDAIGIHVNGAQKTEALSGVISSLKAENVKYNRQIEGLNNELKAFEVQVSNMQEGKSLLTLFRTKINEVKAKMSALNREAYYAKVAAQKERDRIATLAGNSGFLVKEGKGFSADKKSFAIDVKIVQ